MRLCRTIIPAAIAVAAALSPAGCGRHPRSAAAPQPARGEKAEAAAPDPTPPTKPDDLGLTPAEVPDRTPPEGVIPGGRGDRVVIDREGGIVARLTTAGDARWTTPLGGDVGGGRWPHVADVERAYVTHAGGVTALDVRTGRVAWHSPGPNNGLLLSGDLLLATGWGGDAEETARRGQWLLARRTASGEEAFRVALPVEDFHPLPVEEAAGLFVVQGLDAPSGSVPALLVDRAGRVFHQFDRQVMTVVPAGGDRLVLTSREVVRLGADGGVRWAAPFSYPESFAGGGLAPLPCGDVVAHLYCRIADSGVQVMRLDAATGRKRWESACESLWVDHSEYYHDAVAVIDGGRVTITSKGSYGTFVEALDAETGHSVRRRTVKKQLFRLGGRPRRLPRQCARVEAERVQSHRGPSKIVGGFLIHVGEGGKTTDLELSEFCKRGGVE